uniref:Vanin-like protein 1 n=1 Tax=Culex pipiens TaxID=7175 RepID=A0A8D8FJ40_CULPI
MRIVLALLCIFCTVYSTHQLSSPEDDHYWAGVVEFSSKDKWTTTDSPGTYVARTLAKYKEIINSPDADPLDILVFPESTANAIETASFVPDPAEKVAPCNNLRYEPIVRDLSCLAGTKQLYLVVNVVEKASCPENGDERPCASDGLNHFNTNVVFDHRGIVIARYRKFNLFGEAGINTTVSAEHVSFKTDFGVTFGTFICFDLMFDEPALKLVRSGVTDIIFPTMWFSELPFLTGVQIQQAWAYKNNVNLLAAGASYPEVGSTGTGVYAGKRGRIVSVMNHLAETKLYVASVPKIDRPQAEIKKQPTIKYTAAQMDTLKLKRDQIDGYRTMDLPLQKTDTYAASLCQNRLCCNFTIDYDLAGPVTTQPFYRYKMAILDGKRTFDGFADGYITACAIFACTGTTLDTCATRFEHSANTVPMFVFNSIELTGTFPGGEEVFLLPNSVDTSILPLEVDEIEYSEEIVTKDGKPFVEITHKLVKPRSDLYSFAIWGRKFDQDQDPNAAVPVSIGSTLLVLVAAVCSIMFK